MRNSDEVKAVLGDRVHYADNAWGEPLRLAIMSGNLCLTRTNDSSGFGEPWISGNVNLLQGKVDLKFRIEGAKGKYAIVIMGNPSLTEMHVLHITEKATVYFTSIRPSENSEFQIGMYLPSIDLPFRQIKEIPVDAAVLLFQSDTRSSRTMVRSSSSHDRRTSGATIQEESCGRDLRRVDGNGNGSADASTCI